MTIKRQKNFFNLIEITLAIAIIAVGISSVMVLFPVGINTSNAAIAENNIPNMVETLIPYLEAYIQTTTETDWEKSGAFVNNLPKPPDSAVESDKWNPDAIVGFPNMTQSDNDPRYNGQIYKLEQKNENNPDVIDFSAVACFWIEESPKFKMNNQETSLSLKKNASMVLEISWPAEVSYAVRKNLGNIKTYRFELFNTKYSQ